jgi:hypothetical protein
VTTKEILIGIGLGLMVNEFCDLSPWIARKLVAVAARLRYGTTDRAIERREIFASYINDRPGKLFKLLTALAFLGVGILAFLRRRESSLPLEVRWRVSDGMLACGLGAMLAGPEPMPIRPTTLGLIGGIVVTIGGLTLIVAALANRPGHALARGVGFIHCALGLVITAVGVGINVGDFPRSIIDLIFAAILFMAALVFFSIGITGALKRPTK